MNLNKELQGAYTTHTENVVHAINASSIIDFLFGAKVLGADDYYLLTVISERKEKTRRLLALLHTSRHPEAFVKLHEAIKKESAYDWLVKQIDDLRASSKRDKLQAFKRVVTGKHYRNL